MTPVMEKKESIKFQNKPIMLPKASMPIFLLSGPFNWKARERKSKLKIKSMAVDSTLIKRKDARMHKPIVSKKRPRTKRLPSKCINYLSFLSYDAALTENNSRR
jgi:hypothetical protein